MAEPSKVAGGVVNFGVVAAFTAFAAFPFAWMLITTFKQTRDLLTPPQPVPLPRAANPRAPARALPGDALPALGGEHDSVGVWWWPSPSLLAVPAAYSLARLTGPWGEKLGIGIFLTYLVPPTILFIPLVARWWRCSASRIRSGRWCWCTPASPCPSAPGS